MKEDNKTSEDYSGESKLSVRIMGPQISAEKGYDLDSVISSLRDSQTLIRKTYLAAYDRSRFTENDYDSFKVKLKSWREGSLWSDLEIVYTSIVLPVLPFVVDNKEFIWETIKDSYEYLKTKKRLEKEGKTVNVEQKTGQSGISVVNNGNGDVVVLNTPIGLSKYAEKIAPSIQQITENIDSTRVSGIEFKRNSSDEDNESFIMDVEDKELFGNSTLTSDDIISIFGKITSGNFATNTGRIEVISSSVEQIKPGQTYSIKIAENLHAEDKWLDMFLQERPYYCKYSVYSQNPNRIKELYITDWDESEWNDQTA